MAQHGRYAYQQELQRFDLPDSIFQLEINYLWCNIILTLRVIRIPFSQLFLPAISV